MKNNFLITFCIITVVLFACFASCGNKCKSEMEKEQETKVEKILYSGVEEYEVGCFETLSDIAVKYIPSDVYMNDWIADVKRLNGRKTNDIYFGETIKVYYY